MNQEESFITDAIDEEALFFDSYALFEIIEGNKNYKKFENLKMVTTKLNLFELYHGFLKDNNEKLAETSLNEFYPFAKYFDSEVIKEAAIVKDISLSLNSQRQNAEILMSLAII